LSTTNRFEQKTCTVRLRTKVTKGPGSRAAGIAMATSSSTPRSPLAAVKAPHLVARSVPRAVVLQRQTAERRSTQPTEPAESNETKVAETPIPLLGMTIPRRPLRQGARVCVAAAHNALRRSMFPGVGSCGTEVRFILVSTARRI